MTSDDAAAPPVRARLVLATARVQLTPSFGFAQAAAAVPMLADLGVSHVYLSPVLRAAPGSRHGYDVIDPCEFDPERGGEAAFARLVDAAHAHGLGVLLDVVPNHLAGDPLGPAWAHVLRRGFASEFARWFDLGWDSGSAQVRDRILLPMLGTGLDEALANGDVRLVRNGTEATLQVYEQRLPLSVETEAEVASVDDDALASMSSDAVAMRRLLERQHYELAHWRIGTRRLDRRRFFDVAELVGVRQEDPEVFAATHARVLDLVRRGAVDGLRIDHPDGLSDPTGYLARLRGEIGDTWLVVEKILSDGEELPASWPVDGTVGYEHGALVDRLLVASGGEAALTAVVERHAPAGIVHRDGVADGVEVDPLDDVIEQGKRDALAMLFEPELRRLTGLAAPVCGASCDTPEGAPSTDAVVRAALVEMVVACPVYRTYVQPGAAPTAIDAQVLDHLTAHAIAASRHETSVASAVAAIRAVFDRADRSDAEELLVVRFQQLTSAVTAKGIEDTAFYRLPRLASLCEVGADPRQWSASIDQWHSARARMLAHRPLGLVATSTHDSKRSMDARCRLAVLSEVPDLWSSTADRVMARLDEVLGDRPRDRALELLLLQLVIAVHPAGTERLVPAAIKAAREAKRLTTWHDPDDTHERVVEEVVHLLVGDPGCRAAIDPLLAVVVPAGRRNALAATLLVFAGPGVPDLYQGALGWQLALADPDNRDDVDPDDEAELLAAARDDGRHAWDADAIAADERGVSKAHLVHTCLQLRHVHAGAVTGGADYLPLQAIGPAADHVVAHVAGDSSGERFVVIGARLTQTLERTGGWGDTTLVLPEGSWTDVLRRDRMSHAGRVRLDDVVGDLPGALLVRS